MERASRDEWAKRIERWTESGLTGAEFATEIGVKEATLRHWKWALRRHAEEPGWQAKAARARRRRREVPAFVEVAAPAAPSPASVEPLEVTLRNGLKVRFPAEIDPGALQRVLDALEAR
jgi:hypothetical protein